MQYPQTKFPYAIKKTVETDEGDELICPICGGSNLHHREVYSYVRKGGEDSPEGVRVSVQTDLGNTVTVDDDMRDNPSGRRNGIRIRFFCETCDEARKYPGPILQIIQHKGSTYLVWE